MQFISKKEMNSFGNARTIWGLKLRGPFLLLNAGNITALAEKILINNFYVALSFATTPEDLDLNIVKIHVAKEKLEEIISSGKSYEPL